VTDDVFRDCFSDCRRVDCMEVLFPSEPLGCGVHPQSDSKANQKCANALPACPAACGFRLESGSEFQWPPMPQSALQDRRQIHQAQPGPAADATRYSAKFGHQRVKEGCVGSKALYGGADKDMKGLIRLDAKQNRKRYEMSAEWSRETMV